MSSPLLFLLFHLFHTFLWHLKVFVLSKAYRSKTFIFFPHGNRDHFCQEDHNWAFHFRLSNSGFFRSGFNLVLGLTFAFQPPGSVFSCFVLTPLLKNLMLRRNLDSNVKKWGESLGANRVRRPENVHRDGSSCSEWYSESGHWEIWPHLWSFGHTVSPDESLELL